MGANAGIVGMTKEHLGLALALSVPVFVVVTKIDMCPPNILQDNLKLLCKVLRSQGCRKVRRFSDCVSSLESHLQLSGYVICHCRSRWWCAHRMMLFWVQRISYRSDCAPSSRCRMWPVTIWNFWKCFWICWRHEWAVWIVCRLSFKSMIPIRYQVLARLYLALVCRVWFDWMTPCYSVPMHWATSSRLPWRVSTGSEWMWPKCEAVRRRASLWRKSSDRRSGREWCVFTYWNSKLNFWDPN